MNPRELPHLGDSLFGYPITEEVLQAIEEAGDGDIVRVGPPLSWFARIKRFLTGGQP